MVTERRNGNGRRDTDQLSIDMAEVKADVKHIVAGMSNLVTKDEFNPVRNIVYGLVGLTMTAVLVGLLALVIWHGGS